MKKKLEHGLTRIWQVRTATETSEWSGFSFNHFLPLAFSLQDVQLKVKAYILGTDMSNFKYDDFIVVLDVISRYPAGASGSSPSPRTDLQYSSGFLFLFPVRLSSYALPLFPRILWVFSLFLAAIPKEKKFFFIIFIW